MGNTAGIEKKRTQPESESKINSRDAKICKDLIVSPYLDMANDEIKLQNELSSVEDIQSASLRKSKRRKGQKKTLLQRNKWNRKKKLKVEVCEKESKKSLNDSISSSRMKNCVKNANDSILSNYEEVHLEGNERFVGETDSDHEFVEDEDTKTEVYLDIDTSFENMSKRSYSIKHANKSPKKRQFTCNVCKATFATSLDKNAHKVIHANIKNEKQLVCETCSAVFNSEISLKNHCRMHIKKHKSSEVENNEKCPECSFFGTRSTSLKRHMLLKHNTDLDSTPKAHICEHCKRGYNSKISLRKHLVKVHSVKELGPDLVCEQCGERFFCAWELRKHTKYHKERDTPCTYEGCSSKFRSQTELNEHIRNIHIRGRSYKCTYEGCEWSFYRSNALQSHINSIHLQLRKHKCEWPGCDKIFKSQKNLSVHERIHRGQKPIKCDHCDFHCRQRTSLVYHLRKHGIILESEDRRGKHWVPSSTTPEKEDVDVEQAVPRTGCFNTIKVQRTLKPSVYKHSNSKRVSHQKSTTYTNVIVNSWNSNYNNYSSTEQLQNPMHTDQSTAIDNFIDKIIDSFDDKKTD